MGSIPTFPATPNPLVPAPSTDIVHLRVGADRTRCSTIDQAINSRLSFLETHGISISIAQLVANANLYFAGAVADEGAGEEEARMRAAWEALRHWGMVAVPHQRQPGRTVLQVAGQTNSRLTAFRSEVLAIGVALEIGIRLYDTAYPYWAATEGLQPFDLQSSDEAGNEYRIEARGRINRTNVGIAITDVHDKFPDADFSHAAGVIFFPRTNNRGREDILVLDPDGEPSRGLRNRRYRNLLVHYAPIFIAQGGAVRPFGERMRVLAKSSDKQFSDYLKNGDVALQNPRTRRTHASFTWRGTRYLGTFFQDFVWPTWLTNISLPAEGGVFFWGIAREIVLGIENGTLKDFRFSVSERALVDRRDAVTAIVMPDRTLLIWGMTMEDLNKAEDEETRTKSK
jgi:hypothetical protein